MLIVPLHILSSCYQLDIRYSQAKYPVAFGQYLAGYDIVARKGRFQKRFWVYHAADLGQLPIGSREGLAHTEIWQHTFESVLSPGEGIQYLKIQQSQTPLTVLTRLTTLGLVSPTEVEIEGQIVTVIPSLKKSFKK